MKTTILRDYQWKATQFLTGKAAGGARSLGLSAPTGAGKTTILHAFLMKSLPLYSGALIAAPSCATEKGFHKSEFLEYDPKWAGGRTSVIRYEMTEDMFIFPRDDGDLDKREELALLLSPSGHTTPFYLTTHHQLTRWGADALPDDLAGKVLVLDEAHHAGTDEESKHLNTGIGKFATAWMARGGTVVYTTATPFRADGLDVFPAGTETYTRSIAEHAASKYAPADFQLVTVTVDVEAKSSAQIFGDGLSDEEEAKGCGYQTMVDRWIEDGKPKAVFVVPAGKARRAQRWARRLVLALEKASPGVRVVDGVGNDKATKERFLEALESEGKVNRYADSQIDVFISCKRFDEGTDWPLCSHVYNWGVPSSFGLILQRWGRTFRDKSKYPDYPEAHRQQATMVFFVLRVGDEVLEQFEKQHRDHALLLACYLADWKTAREYRAQLRLRFEKAWARGGRKRRTEVEEREDIDREQAFVVSDLVRNQVVAKVAQLEASLGRPPEAGEVREYLAKFDTTDEEWMAVEQMFLEQLDEEEQEAVINKLRAKLPTQYIRADLLAAFREVTEEYRHRTVQVLDDVVSFYTRITGGDATEVASRLKDRLRKPDLTEEMIVEAAKRHHARTGKWPSAVGGDATKDFGFAETWTSVNAALTNGCRDLPGGSSISRLLFDSGHRTQKFALTEDLIFDAASRHYAQKGDWPSTVSGAVCLITGHIDQWADVDRYLRHGNWGLCGGSSLLQLLTNRGARISPALDVEMITVAAERHHARTGEWPTSGSGDATMDFGFAETWGNINAALRHGNRTLLKGSSLSKLLINHGARNVSGRLTAEVIFEAMVKHRDRTGKWPTQRSGDAEIDFGFAEVWGNVEAALIRGKRNLPGNSSLFKLRQAMGVCDDHREEMIVKAAKKYYIRMGRYPTKVSGDASDDFGRLETWGAINQILRKGGRGLPGGSSLSQFLKEHGLK